MNQQELQKHEKYFKEVQQNVISLNQAIETFEKSYPSYLDLKSFYTSSEWLEAYETSNSEGSDLSYEILSEDDIFNLIGDVNQLLGHLLQLSSKMYDDL
ncbi:hypothetical protein HMPREF9318_01153 [Streptococcus urinalis FB127-CNA-2]|uniref:DUF4298 domain-containing protein n=1 Tax=Streptococcus urinalis 2285-97 TaxID=764291 RepID=G5KI27_9STRE|nr:DUF4298 domain-containing protein [Streptococcus urinalis]EHJ57246.1 hypothetical protein STRUR_0309 [Streptococcus urinalis 2285-97]EKS20515.1 hypothetical protein HMPREF9318_01153 [Streptococcus urinalis FB127-CNA-2]VEF31208.1 Uncharacterised protein [Streptococcus urinalis]